MNLSRLFYIYVRPNNLDGGLDWCIDSMVKIGNWICHHVVPFFSSFRDQYFQCRIDIKKEDGRCHGLKRIGSIGETIF